MRATRATRVSSAARRGREVRVRHGTLDVYGRETLSIVIAEAYSHPQRE
jgi:hypothetical protein